MESRSVCGCDKPYKLIYSVQSRYSIQVFYMTAVLFTYFLQRQCTDICLKKNSFMWTEQKCITTCNIMYYLKRIVFVYTAFKE